MISRRRNIKLDVGSQICIQNCRETEIAWSQKLLPTKKNHLLIDAAPTVFVIRSFDVVPTLVSGLETRLHSHVGGSVDRLACRTLIETTTNHVAGEFHILVDSVVNSLDPISIVHSKLRIPRRLDGL